MAQRDSTRLGASGDPTHERADSSQRSQTMTVVLARLKELRASPSKRTTFIAGAALLFLVGVGGASYYALTGTGRFRSVTIDHAMAGDVKAMGDLDGDGFLDLVIGGMAGSENMVWYQAPTWNKHPLLAPTKEFTTDMQLADVDADGDLDVVVADGDGPNNVQWLENPRPKKPATQSSWTRHTIGSHGGWVHDVVVHDFDGDGRVDVVTRKSSTKLWFQDAGGKFVERDLTSLVGGGEGLGSGDVDGDGDVDLVANCSWFENPDDARKSSWMKHAICQPWDDALTAAIGDVNDDGVTDVVITSQHKPVRLSVFSPKGSPKGANWQEKVVDEKAGSHKINLGDFDLDGRLDIQIALEKEHVRVYLNRGAGSFQKLSLPHTGHNLRVGDVGRDGDLDLFGAEFTGGPPTRLWENLTANAPQKNGAVAPGWSVQRLTNAHVQTFGLAFADIDQDGRPDMVSGPFWYRNEGRSDRTWPQHALPVGMHACLTLDVDGDQNADLIAQKDDGDIGVYWLELEASGTVTSRQIGKLPRASHPIGAQGQVVGDLVSGGRPEVVMTSGGGTFYFSIPDQPESGPWPRHLVAQQTSDEGVAVGDVDRDGSVDVVTTSGGSKQVQVHLRDETESTTGYRTVQVAHLPDAVYLDRVATADLNGDGRLDIVVTEENGRESDARTHWFEQPERLESPWPRHLVVVQGSTHSLDVGDFDRDGDVDLVLGEHRGARKTTLWLNDGQGRFSPRILSDGFESHLGARFVDLDGDRQDEVVSIAWDQPGTIFALWNRASRK